MTLLVMMTGEPFGQKPESLWFRRNVVGRWNTVAAHCFILVRSGTTGVQTQAYHLRRKGNSYAPEYKARE